MTAEPGDLRTLKLTAVSYGCASLLSVAYLGLAGRALGPTGYADFAAAVAIATLLSVAFSGLSITATHRAAVYAAAGQPERIRGLTRHVLGRLIMWGGAGAVVWILAAGWLSAELRFRSNAPLLAAYAVAMGLMLMSVLRGAMRGAQAFGLYNASIVGDAALRLVIGAALVVALSGGTTAAVSAYSISALIVSAVMWRAQRREGAAIPPAPGDLAGSFGPMTVLVMTMAVFQNLDMLVVKRYFDQAAAGEYGAVAALARMSALAAMPLEAVMLPRITYLLERGSDARRGMVRMLGLAAAMAAVPLIVFAALPALILRTVYGDTFQSGAALLFPLALALLSAHLAYVVMQALIPNGRAGLVALFLGVAAVEVIVLLLWHPTTMSIVLTVLATRGTLLLLTLALALRRLPRRSAA